MKLTAVTCRLAYPFTKDFCWDVRCASGVLMAWIRSLGPVITAERCALSDVINGSVVVVGACVVDVGAGGLVWHAECTL
jgi:hypothetical protein